MTVTFPASLPVLLTRLSGLDDRSALARPRGGVLRTPPLLPHPCVCRCPRLRGGSGGVLNWGERLVTWRLEQSVSKKQRVGGNH